VWAPELSRAALLDAIRARRTFATSGVKLSLCFAVNDAQMGAVIDADRAPEIQVDVCVPAEEGRLRWLQVVRDGRVIQQAGGEGQRGRLTFTDDECPAGTSWYYLRVALADGNLAWSSPVWVRRE